jgi:hypothetical protein
MRHGRSTRTRPPVTRRVGIQRPAQAGTWSGRANSMVCQAHWEGVAGSPFRRSWMRNAARFGPVRRRVTSCLSAAARSTCPEIAGSCSSSIRLVGGRPSWLVLKVRTCPSAIADLRLAHPGGSRSCNAAHSVLVRRLSSTGQVSTIAWTTVRRCAARRSARAAASSATRRTRSETYTSSGPPTAQPSRRIAIHPLDGNARPSGPTPEPILARSPSFQWVATTAAAICRESAASHPTRSTSSREGTDSPVISSTARKAVQVAVAVNLPNTRSTLHKKLGRRHVFQQPRW